MIKQVIRKAGLVILILLVLLVIFYWDLIGYGLRQGYGQLKIIWYARPVSEYLDDPGFPDSLKTKLRLIDEVRQFSIDSLGLKDTDNYKTLYDQKGKEIMWVVLAAQPFSLEPKEWTFPVIGTVNYKGYFDQRLAENLKKELEAEGWDVIIRNPGGWSTLGWFTDPILSKMLSKSEGDLANLIIHEMSHATIFVKDSIEFNENLATFIGDRGAEQFLLYKYGAGSKEYREYIAEDEDYLKYVDHMLRGGEMLDSLYKTFTDDDSIEEKMQRKKEAIEKIVLTLDTLTLQLTPTPSLRFRGKLPNNAYFMNFRQYQAKQDDFWCEYTVRFNGNLRAYIHYLSRKYPFL
jgi:predicted aminopeptidase